MKKFFSAAGGLTANRTSSNALPYAGLAIGAGLVVYEAVQFHPGWLLTFLDDDAYVIDTLADKLVEKFEKGEG